MNQTMEEVVKRVAGMPVEMQDMIAKEFLQDLEWEEAWEKTSINSHASVLKKASEALEEYRNRRTEEKGFDEL